jgi:SHAQKYF class myb-like DNA-binding protein
MIRPLIFSNLLRECNDATSRRRSTGYRTVALLLCCITGCSSTAKLFIMSVSDDKLPISSVQIVAARRVSTSTMNNSRAPHNHSISAQGRSSQGGTSRLGRKNIDTVGRWSEEEHRVFLVGIEKHGKQWKTIADMIGTRTVVQVREQHARGI